MPSDQRSNNPLFIALADKGLVRLVCEDEKEGYFDVYGHCDGDCGIENCDCDEIVMREIELHGCYVIVAEFRLSLEHEWKWADSVGMNTGPWSTNPYVESLETSAINAYLEAAEAEAQHFADNYPATVASDGWTWVSR